MPGDGVRMKLLLSGIPIALLLAACAQPIARVCALPPLSEAEVRKIGSSHLEVKGVDAAFRANAESRVTAVGCHHEYEVSEKLDSFGVGFVVEVDATEACSGCTRLSSATWHACISRRLHAKHHDFTSEPASRT